MCCRSWPLLCMSPAILAATAVFAVRTATSESAAADEFRPIKEAEMPAGFPAYTPVGQIEVKTYPAYRRASTVGASGFWTLFMHIKRNDVAMTAPVEMNYGDPRSPNAGQLAMSFLYERPDQGVVGRQGSVEVEDVPAATVVSIGCRGARTASAVNEAREKLLAWLKANEADYVAAGPIRVMGYNSPFVPRDKNFFEVQIPIKPAKVD